MIPQSSSPWLFSSHDEVLPRTKANCLAEASLVIESSKASPGHHAWFPEHHILCVFFSSFAGLIKRSVGGIAIGTVRGEGWTKGSGLA